MIKAISIWLVLPLLCLARAECDSLLINNLEQYNNWTATVFREDGCQQVTIDNVPLRHMQITGSIISLVIQNCPLLESVTIRQLSVSTLGPIVEFANNTNLVMYDIILSNQTYLLFNSVAYPQSFDVRPKALVSILYLDNINWSDIGILVGYNNLIGIQVSNAPNIRDLSIIGNNKFSTSVNLVQLDNLLSLSFLSNTVSTGQLIIEYLPSVTSLEGLNSLHMVNGAFIVDNVPQLQDVSQLSNLRSTTVSWSNVPNICCPDISTGIYTNLAASSIPPCKNCFSITDIQPNTSPLEGGILVSMAYVGGIRSSSISILWGQNYVTCTIVSFGVITCITPKISSAGVVNLQYSFDASSWLPLGTTFSYIQWQNIIPPAPGLEQSYNTITLPQLLPPDNSAEINKATLVIWSLAGCSIVITIIIFLIFSLPNSCDIIRTPVVKNLGYGSSVTASRRTPLGSLFSISCIILLVSVLLSSIISYSLGNAWGATSLVNPTQVINRQMSYNVQFAIFPSNICEDNTLLLTPQTTAIVLGNECLISWNLSAISLGPTSFSFKSSLWSTYAYYIKYSLNVTGDMISSIQGTQTVDNSNDLLKGGQGQVDIMSSVSTLTEGMNVNVGMVFLQNQITNIPTTNLSSFLSSDSLGFSLNLKPTDYHQNTYIQYKQTSLEFLAQILALCSGVITLIRLMMYIIARKIYIHSSKPDIELNLRRSTVKDQVQDTSPETVLNVTISGAASTNIA